MEIAEIIEVVERNFANPNAQVTGVDFENGKAKSVLIGSLSDEYREGVKFILVLQTLGAISGKLTRMIFWDLFSGRKEVPDLFAMMSDGLEELSKIDGFMDFFVSSSKAAARAFEKEPNSKLPEGTLRELSDEEQLIFADGGFPADQPESETDDWDNQLGAISVTLGASQFVQDDYHLITELKDVWVDYSRSMSDISSEHRATMKVLQELAKNDSNSDSLYHAAYAALCFDSGKTEQTIKECPDDGVHHWALDELKERISRKILPVNAAMIEVSKIVDRALSGSMGNVIQEQAQQLITKNNSILSDQIGEEGLFNSDDGLFLGKTTEVSAPVHALTEKSLITIAGPGSGKTQCHVLPNLNTFQGGAIVLDVKGECFLNSKTWRAENVGNILAFAPASKNSRRYNPLSFVSQDPDQVWEDARLLAELLVVSKSQSDPTWENQGRQLLTLLIAYVVYKPEEQRNMASVLDLLNDIGFDIALNTILAEGSIYPSAMRRTANNFLKMKQDAEKQYQGVKSGALQHLAIWEGPVVEKLTSTSDWSPLDFREPNPPTLYLIVQPNQIESYAPLLRVIIAQHVRMLMQHSPDRDAPPILFMLDEMPRLGKMEPIREALEVGRSYRLQLWMFAQFAGQLYDAYGKEIAEGMIESCGVRMYMNPGQETAEKLSKALGTRENMLTGKTEPVVTPQALTGPEWKDDILVFATGEKPLRLKKSFFHEQQAAG